MSQVSVPVVRTPINRAAMPLGDFIALTPSGSKRLATNTNSYPDTVTETTLEPTEFRVRADCYGATALDMSNVLRATFRDNVGVESFVGSGFDIAPLHSTDATQMPVVTGEDQYLERWTFEFVLQYNPVITLTTETTGTPAVPNVINVDVAFPPGA